VVPDIAFPSLYDAEEIGESALDHALNWDQINAVRHRRYDDLSTVLPRITTLFEERSHANPDFVFLEDQISLAAATRKIEELPLNEAARKALRESQENKALAIENKRRVAQGEEPLASLDEDETEEPTDAETDASSEADIDEAGEEDEDNIDVLLTEAGNVLVDALVLKQQRYAVHSGQQE
jgi:carboxyl-terminal processing protease